MKILTMKLKIFLINRRQRSNAFDILSFRVTECDTGNYLEVAEVREKRPMRQQKRIHFCRWFSLNKLIEVVVKHQSLV
jgi:hypothetical protein